MIKLFIFTFVLSSCTVFGQKKNERIYPTHSKYTGIMEELGNPLQGDPVLIIKYFSGKEGTYLFFLNEGKARTKTSISTNPIDLYAGLFLEDHGGIVEQIRFKHFAGLLSQPIFLLNYCVAEDADENDSPEFYLTYFEDSDGLDAKPLKVIVYNKKGKVFIKSKITAWIPFQEEDYFRIEKDDNFKKLPASIQKKAERLLNEAKIKL